MEEARVEIRAGEKARVEVELPSMGSGFSWGSNKYVRLDLELQVPETLHLNIKDSSGSMHLAGIGGDFTVLKDGSGSIRAGNVTGSVSLPAD